MKRLHGALCALALGAGLAYIPARSAHAEASGVSVEQTGCDGMDTGRVAELVALELASAFGTSEHGLALRVSIDCRPEGLKIEVLDPVTDKNVGRKYPALSADEKEPERAVALAASQLFVVSWLELLVPQRGQQTGEVAPETVEGARQAASESIEQEGPGGEISAFSGLRLRALPDLVPVARVGLRGGGEVAEGWALFAVAAFETGRANRELGTASIYAPWVGFGAARRWPVSSAVSFEAGAVLSGGYALLRGKPFDNADNAGEIDGLTAEIAVLAGPVLRLDRFVSAIDLQGGYALRNPVGAVEGEDDVSVGGFFFGAMLSLGLVVG